MCGLIFVLVAALVTVASGQVVLNHGCQNVSVVQKFDMAKYMGFWYDYEKVNSFQARGKCLTANYTLRSDGTVSVHNKMVISSTGETTEIFGSATLDSSVDEAKLKVVFSTHGNREAPYWVLSTDYTNYSVVWACESQASGSKQFAWVLTRSRSPSKSVLLTAREVIARNNLTDLPLELTPQNCS
ncbi:apolipoprotein D-like isoform X2 [Bacillus rossius redtenbacheri]